MTPEPRTILTYTYVEDILERRTPHREAHLAHARRWIDDGRLERIGVLGDPPHGALLVFTGDDHAAPREFAEDDPYVQAGLVTDHKIETWKLVEP